MSRERELPWPLRLSPLSFSQRLNGRAVCGSRRSSKPVARPDGSGVIPMGRWGLSNRDGAPSLLHKPRGLARRLLQMIHAVCGATWTSGLSTLAPEAAGGLAYASPPTNLKTGPYPLSVWLEHLTHTRGLPSIIFITQARYGLVKNTPEVGAGRHLVSQPRD